MFVRTIDIVGTQTNLPAFGSACRASDIILPVYLIDVCTFHTISSSKLVSVLEPLFPDFHFFSFHRFGIRIQLRDIKRTLSVDDINFSVIIKPVIRHRTDIQERLYAPKDLSHHRQYRLRSVRDLPPPMKECRSPHKTYHCDDEW